MVYVCDNIIVIIRAKIGHVKRVSIKQIFG